MQRKRYTITTEVHATPMCDELADKWAIYCAVCDTYEVCETKQLACAALADIKSREQVCADPIVVPVIVCGTTGARSATNYLVLNASDCVVVWATNYVGEIYKTVVDAETFKQQYKEAV